MSDNRYAAACAEDEILAAAIERCCQQLIQQGLASPDVVFAFASTGYGEDLDRLPGRICEHLSPRHVVGCSAEMLIGGDREYEQQPVVSLLAARWPTARLRPFRLEFSQTADGIMVSGLPEPEGTEGPADRLSAFVFGDPFSSVPGSLIERLAVEWPGVPLLGGMASGALMPGDHRLFLNEASYRAGAVGLLLEGGPVVRGVVSQGCRPVGPHFVVTAAENNIIYELGGKPALEQCREVFRSMSDADRMIARQGFHLGIAMSEYRERFERGDFLIANVLGADPGKQALAIGGTVRVGQTVRFHVRDAETADEDLRSLLHAQAEEGTAVEAALLVSCNGRGTRMFSQPHHDVRTLLGVHPDIPVAGFFAQGEFGPVGGRNYIHGFTAVLALFEREISRNAP